LNFGQTIWEGAIGNASGSNLGTWGTSKEHDRSTLMILNMLSLQEQKFGDIATRKPTDWNVKVGMCKAHRADVICKRRRCFPRKMSEELSDKRI
jgi:hypothetical protein